MKLANRVLEEIMKQALVEAFASIDESSSNVTFDPSKDSSQGDYQTSHALKIAKKLKRAPIAIASEASDILTKNPLFAKVVVSHPGFINMTLSDDALLSFANSCLESSNLLVPKKSSEKVIVEFSSPNIAKSMHVGHLRSTIIGESIARLLEFLGYDVLRLNHVGDFGTQFGMLITYMKKYKPFALESDKSTIEELVGWYKAAKKLFDEDENFKEESRKEVVNLQSGEEESVSCWTKICDISRKGFNEIYERLGVKITERGESFYRSILKEVVDDFENKELAIVDDGALCVFMDEFKNKDGDTLPLIIRKSDGGFNYATTDLAAFKYRVSNDNAKRIIIVTDLGQKLHFSMVEKACKLIGYINPEEVTFDHVPFGLVLSPDGKKYKTRSGETEKLLDLLDEAVIKAKKILDERGVVDNEELAKVLGISAVKYADLSSNRIKDYTFSYDRMLKFEGNTAAFILYSYVRIQSIKRKAEIEISSLKGKKIEITNDSERDLILHLSRFSGILDEIKDSLLLNHLTEYLYHLAEKFNAFFRDSKVHGSDKMESRLLLCELTGRHIKQGLDILGIDVINRM